MQRGQFESCNTRRMRNRRSRFRSSLRSKSTKSEMGNTASIFRSVCSYARCAIKDLTLPTCSCIIMYPSSVLSFRRLACLFESRSSKDAKDSRYCNLGDSAAELCAYRAMVAVTPPKCFEIQCSPQNVFAEDSRRAFPLHGPLWQHCWRFGTLRQGFLVLHPLAAACVHPAGLQSLQSS